MDTESLLRSLNAHSVRYVIIGATAFPVHGYARATLDIDIFIDPTLENATRVRQALAAFGYDVSDISLEDLLTKKILIRQDLLETDIHPFVKGADFDGVWRNRVEDRLGTDASSLRWSRRSHPHEGSRRSTEGPRGPPRSPCDQRERLNPPHPGAAEPNANARG